MKLYYKPGACSLASHIVLYELGVPFEIEKVDTAAGLTQSGADYSKINAKGYVPTLQMTDDAYLTEGPAILQFLADTKPETGLAPAIGTLERARMLEQLTFVSSELHKAFGPLFKEDVTEDEKANSRKAVAQKFNSVESLFADDRETVTGSNFTIADAYLFVVANWANFTGIDLQGWPKLEAYLARISERSSVQIAMRAEGLIQ
ncbi:glutathione transferase GstA [Ahrensia marina]|uniref:Glutathione S-transferase n=1 Tax=Ahrensia marina TaxID=1514904 RepID=A0A0N1J6C5_9HYPH|nr:glutathione transferase GstA [Ahrensia marina]KPB00378.1 glutathione S-transferase [Ahrensia marina]